jgi:uncharacterized membrane protein
VATRRLGRSTFAAYPSAALAAGILAIVVRIRESLARLDERAGLNGNRLPLWVLLLVTGALLTLTVIGIVRDDQEVVLFAGLVLGLFIVTVWRTRR